MNDPNLMDRLIDWLTDFFCSQCPDQRDNSLRFRRTLWNKRRRKIRYIRRQQLAARLQTGSLFLKPANRSHLNRLELLLDAPVFIYIHGGYWQDLERCISSYCVAPLYEAGNVVVVVGYDLTPKVELADIIGEIQAAVSTVLKWAFERNCTSVSFG